MFQITIAIEGHQSAHPHHELTADEAVILGQIIEIDGEDAVIIDREEIRNGSRRVCGERMILTESAWNTVQESVRILEQIIEID